MKKSVLKIEAEKLVEELGILSLVKEYAVQAQVVGSVATDLLVKRDIDVHVLLEEGYPSLDVACELARRLLKRSKVSRVRIEHYKTLECVNLALDNLQGDSGDWSFDVWLTHRRDRTGFSDAKRLSDDLTDEQREAIMKIKRYAYDRGLLSNGFSTKIYDAVLNHGVLSVEAFCKFKEKK